MNTQPNPTNLTTRTHSKYSYTAKNVGKDLIYETRLKLVRRLKIDTNKNPKIFGYVMNAELGIILI